MQLPFLYQAANVNKENKVITIAKFRTKIAARMHLGKYILPIWHQQVCINEIIRYFASKIYNNLT